MPADALHSCGWCSAHNKLGAQNAFPSHSRMIISCICDGNFRLDASARAVTRVLHAQLQRPKNLRLRHLEGSTSTVHLQICETECLGFSNHKSIAQRARNGTQACCRIRCVRRQDCWNQRHVFARNVAVAIQHATVFCMLQTCNLFEGG